MLYFPAFSCFNMATCLFYPTKHRVFHNCHTPKYVKNPKGQNCCNSHNFLASTWPHVYSIPKNTGFSYPLASAPCERDDGALYLLSVVLALIRSSFGCVCARVFGCVCLFVCWCVCLFCYFCAGSHREDHRPLPNHNPISQPRLNLFHSSSEYSTIQVNIILGRTDKDRIEEISSKLRDDALHMTPASAHGRSLPFLGPFPGFLKLGKGAQQEPSPRRCCGRAQESDVEDVIELISSGSDFQEEFLGFPRSIKSHSRLV